ncbi:MAG: hypothetical protein C0622_12905 [Desulfuromonas sp.]|nr:MAG: hypothetical protein C0622_12905 [Desulfuromonas sp.]
MKNDLRCACGVESRLKMLIYSLCKLRFFGNFRLASAASKTFFNTLQTVSSSCNRLWQGSPRFLRAAGCSNFF